MVPFFSNVTSSAPPSSRKRTSIRSSSGGRHVFSHEVGLDRQFAMAAVHQHRQLHPARPAKIGQGIQRRARGAPAEKNVVHQNDRLAGDVEGNDGGLHVGAGWRSKSSRCMPTSMLPTGTAWYQMAGKAWRPGAAPGRRRRDECRPARPRRCFRCVRRFRGRCGSGRCIAAALRTRG